MFEIINVTKEYAILNNKHNNNYPYSLRHMSCRTDDYPYGSPVIRGRCHNCKKKTDEKITFLYKLWMFQNNKQIDEIKYTIK